MAPAEKLDVQGYSRPIAGGKQSVEISVNGKRVISGALSAKAPHGTFHATYEGHEIVADCTLAARVNCTISVDGMPQAQSGGG
jgi:hypothetical protein